ncbi:MAG: integrase core domain-containing protein [Akkermansia sp.]|nr:integrase core domain-containing protein [Akkermansia sp.]
MERFWRTYKHEFFLHREPKSLEDAIEMTSEWMEYYNRERPHSALKNCSPLMYRENLATPCRRIFGAIFPLRHGSRRFAPRPRYHAYATKSLQKWLDIRGYRMI